METYACHLKQQMYYLWKGSFSDSTNFTIIQRKISSSKEILLYVLITFWDVSQYYCETNLQNAASTLQGSIYYLHLFCFTSHYKSHNCCFNCWHDWANSVLLFCMILFPDFLNEEKCDKVSECLLFFRDRHDFPLLFRIADFKQMIFKCCACHHIASLDTAKKK